MSHNLFSDLLLYPGPGTEKVQVQCPQPALQKTSSYVTYTQTLSASLTNSGQQIQRM
ncbi:hypothetical protein GDO78_019276 [Eleutherodactylus coqui]|uniref:Uncharacterized protein n=1 Tax=Eleutherodactylus coqui TaxID=57060 RepID=A0A8J6BD61_ELECQ|nr:hypothetical protein GDO78_019276 [Eleutherodactylus coqui]